MSSSEDIPLLERPAFFDGQRLVAQDLANAQVYNQELRWLHNRSLHSWGIALGFAVNGDRGARSTRVNTGYAIDCMGRDLVLNAPLELPIPAVASASGGGAATYYLTVSFAEDSQLDPITRTGVCNTSGAVRRPEMPVIRWQNPNDTNPASRYRFGLDVVLATVQILNCQLEEVVSIRERRDAVPAQQPYVAAGGTSAGDTHWRLWPNDDAALGVATTVTTSGAGFQTTPRYQANVIGERLMHAAAGGDSFLVDGCSQVAQATASYFEVRIILPEGTSSGIGHTDTFTREDYGAVVSRIATANPGATVELLNGVNGPSLAVGKMMSYYQELGQLVPSDFKEPLEKISQRNGITLDALLGANGWDQDLNNVSVSQGSSISIPGPALELNPAKVFKPEFMDVLKKDLAWHVVWTGVEG